MSYQKITLRNGETQIITNELGEEVELTAKEVLELDIKALEWKGEKVYPNWPKRYERIFSADERFVVTNPRQIVLEPAEYDENGNEIKAAVLGDWESKLVLPAGYDTSHLNTVI